MSHNFFDYDSSGPRPPIPGEETTTNQKVCLIGKNILEETIKILKLGLEKNKQITCVIVIFLFLFFLFR